MDPVTLLSLVSSYRYPILVPLALVAGFPIGMVVGVAIRLGHLELIPAMACLMLGELIGDVFWYWVGYRWGEGFARRYGKYVGITPWGIETAKRLFQKYNKRILITSKLTTGLGLAIVILFTAGLSRVSFRDYMIANLAGQFFWTGGLVAVGYFFGDLYLGVNSGFEKASVIVLFLITLACFFGFVRYLKSRIV